MAWDDGITYAGDVATDDPISANMLNGLTVQRGTFAARPSAGNTGVIYLSTNGKDGTGAGDYLYFDNGSAWVEVGYIVSDAAQTFAGVKTFGSIPVGPASSPTTDNQLARKKYVDDTLTQASALTNASVGNVTVETDGASVNITVAGGLICFLGRTVQGGGSTCTVRFYDPSGVVTVYGLKFGFSAGSGASGYIAGTSIANGDTSSSPFIAFFKPTQTGVHKITIQFDLSDAGNSANTLATWVS